MARNSIVPVVTRLVERAQTDGHLRSDFVATDVPIIELMLSSVSAYTSVVAPDLWRRYLAIVLDGLARRSEMDRATCQPGPSPEVIQVAMSCQKVRRG